MCSKGHIINYAKFKPCMLTLENIQVLQETPKKESFFFPKSKAPPVEEEKKTSFFPKSRAPPTENQPLEEKKSRVKNSFYSPKQKDTLFWCYFIIKSGFSAYEYPGTTTFVNEKEMKFQCIEELRKSKQILKVKKIKNLGEDVEYELANKDRIGMKTFIALCIATNINVLFIHKKKCFELTINEEEPVHVVHQIEENGHTKYYYEVECSEESIDKYKKSYYKWENVDKPLKAPSSYKVKELNNLCKIFDISFSQKKTKKEIYDAILFVI